MSRKQDCHAPSPFRGTSITLRVLRVKFVDQLLKYYVHPHYKKKINYRYDSAVSKTVSNDFAAPVQIQSVKASCGNTFWHCSCVQDNGVDSILPTEPHIFHRIMADMHNNIRRKWENKKSETFFSFFLSFPPSLSIF